jgi:hypothetical protein
VRLARANINAAALVALLEGGVFDELPNLRVVVTTLAVGGVLFAGGFGDGARSRKDAPALARRHVYIDSMGLHPVLMRAAVDLLGIDHVLVGTDWPIAVEKSRSLGGGICRLWVERAGAADGRERQYAEASRGWVRRRPFSYVGFQRFADRNQIWVQSGEVLK